MEFFKELVKQADEFLSIYNSALSEGQTANILMKTWVNNFTLLYDTVGFYPDDDDVGLDEVHFVIVESYPIWVELSEVGDE